MQNLKQHLSFVNNKFENINMAKHFHDEYSFSLIYDGNHSYENEKEKFTFGSGMIQVVNPYEMHSTKNSSWSYLNIMPSTELINDIAKSLTQDDSKKDILFHPIITDSQAIKLFHHLFVLMTDKEESKMAIDTAMIEFFECALRYHSSQNKDKIVNITCTKQELNTALEYMNDYEKKDEITLDDISSQIGISKYHFIKEFKKYIGITPNQYLQIKKANWTKELLQKDIPLSHIAYECGFTDQSYMIKVFKKFYGYTPTKLNNLLI